MIAGPEMSRLSKDFEALYLRHTDITESHHEQTKGSQQSFHQHVTSLVKSMEDLGNPFTEQSLTIYSLLTQKILRILLLYRQLGKLKRQGKQFIIYLQKIPHDTTYFPTQKYKTPYHATNVIIFRITILHFLTTSKKSST